MHIVLNVCLMNGRVYHGKTDASLNSKCRLDAEAAVLTLSEVQKLAAERRTAAEATLAQAREFEDDLTNKRNTIASLISVVETAKAAEDEVAASLSSAREKLTAAVASATEARAEVSALLRTMDDRRDARVRAEAEVAGMRERIELISETNGLSAEAVQRIVERRIADRLRQRNRHGAG